MLIRNWCLFCAGVLVLQIFSLGALPFELAEPGNTLWHLLAYAALTLLAWIGSGGRWPISLVVGVMALGLVDELRQGLIPGRSANVADFLADAMAAAVTGVTLYWKTGARTCAESSAR